MTKTYSNTSVKYMSTLRFGEIVPYRTVVFSMAEVFLVLFGLVTLRDSRGNLSVFCRLFSGL